MFCFAAVTRKTRIIDVVYNASNNELVRTKTLVKGCIVTIDATPFRSWYESHYTVPLGRRKTAKLVNILNSTCCYYCVDRFISIFA
jgi:ribosomal protein S8E